MKWARVCANPVAHNGGLPGVCLSACVNHESAGSRLLYRSRVLAGCLLHDRPVTASTKVAGANSAPHTPPPPAHLRAMSSSKKIGGEYGDVRANIDGDKLNAYLVAHVPAIAAPVDIKQFKVRL